MYPHPVPPHITCHTLIYAHRTGAGIDEDPVTGSAHTTLAAYWYPRLSGEKEGEGKEGGGGSGKSKYLYARQMSMRGGSLRIEVDGERVLIAGTCVLYMKGEVYVEW